MSEPSDRSDGSDGHRRGRTIATAVALLVVAAASVWLRWPGLTEGGFASHDVAGILHEAMVLHDGGLPYVDTIELKAPGTFWLAKWLAGPDGTDIARFQIWAGVFGVTSLLAVGLAGWRLMGAGAGIGAAVLYGLHDLHLDSIDANYVTWAQTPMVLAAVAVLVVPTITTARGRWGVLVLAGALAGMATLCKRPAGIVVLVVLVVAWLDARERKDVGPSVLAVLGGVALSHAPILIVYATAGQLSALWDGYFVSKWGLAYVAEGGRPSGAHRRARGGAGDDVLPRAAPDPRGVFDRERGSSEGPRPDAAAVGLGGAGPGGGVGRLSLLQGLLPRRAAAAVPARRGAVGPARGAGAATTAGAAGAAPAARPRARREAGDVPRSAPPRSGPGPRSGWSQDRRAHRPADGGRRSDLGLGLAPVGRLRLHRSAQRIAGLQVDRPADATQRRHLARRWLAPRRPSWTARPPRLLLEDSRQRHPPEVHRAWVHGAACASSRPCDTLLRRGLSPRPTDRGSGKVQYWKLKDPARDCTLLGAR